MKLVVKSVINEMFHRRNLIVMLFLIVFGFGIYSYIVIPKQEMPEIDTPYMAISITAPGVSATYMESEIVKDMEKLIVTYPDVMEVRSYVYDNFALSYVLFNYSASDPDALTVEIFTKINELELDDSISEIKYDAGFDDPHIIYALHSDKLSSIELEGYSEEFKNELMTVKEVQSVSIDSTFQEEVVITLDSTMLQAYGLTITEIYQIIYANSLNIPLGGISTIYGTISISGYTEFNELSDLESLIIIPEVPTISPLVTLSDLSTIELVNTSEKRFLFNDQHTVFLSLYFDDDIDFTKMGDTITETKEKFLSTQNNEDLAIDEMLYLPDYVNNQINNVFYSLLIAIGVVMVVVLIGIGFRNSLLIVVTIPVIIFGTIGILYLGNFELHKLTIVGLIVSIGIMVDNSIVITEGVKRYIDHGINKVDAAKQSILDNFAPVLSSTLTTVAAFIVLVMLPGFLGEIVSSMPLTVIITISLSYIVSMVLSPVVAVLFLKRSKTIKQEHSVHEKRIKAMIHTTLKFPIIWLLISLIGLGLSAYFVFTNQPLDLYPNDERSVIYIDYENKVLGDIESTNTLHDDIVDEFVDNEHILNYSSSIGGNLPHFHFSAELITERSHFGRIYINLDYNEDDLLNYVKVLENQYKDFDTAKISVNILELSPPIAPVRLTVSGDDIEEVDETSSLLFNDITELDNVKTYNITQNTISPKYQITYNKSAIASSFITKAQIDQIIAINLNGFDLQEYRYNNHNINININSDIDEITDLYTLTVHSDTLDTDLPLSNFITISEQTDYSVIYRFNNENVSFIDLYFTDDSSLLELENDVKDIVNKTDTSNVTITYGGENELFEEIYTDLIQASVIALVLIFIVMFIQFNNFIKPLIVFLTIPLSFTGSFLFLLIFDESITATALVGMVSLLGVTVNTGILLVEYISRQHASGQNVIDASIEAVYLRFRPIMLTSMTTILGLIPLLLTGGNFFRPMAITFMGGMVTSTLITIFLVPSVYKLIYHRKQKKSIE